MFAAREAVQTSLGFSPFELVFGHTPRGPLKLLKEALLEEDHPESIINRICNVRYKLQRANEFARENMETAQSDMKSWYDRKARRRSFKPGDRVLALLPVHGSPLEARYCGPYTIREKCNDVDYIIDTPGRRRSRRLCHINMLKSYHNRGDVKEKPVALTAVVGQAGEEEPDTNEESRCVMRLSNSEVLNNLDTKLGHLPDPEKVQIKSLLHEFIAIFPDAPGRTTAAVHHVDVGDAAPIKQHQTASLSC